MVHAQDLRIGNWILYDGHECRVWGIQYVVPDVAYQVIIDAHKGVGGYDFDGIPLSSEWLIRFGFEKTADKDGVTDWTHGDVVVYSADVGIGIQYKSLLESYTTSVETETKYVHQLQNLYFALTGSELTTEEEKKK